MSSFVKGRTTSIGLAWLAASLLLEVGQKKGRMSRRRHMLCYRSLSLHVVVVVVVALSLHVALVCVVFFLPVMAECRIVQQLSTLDKLCPILQRRELEGVQKRSFVQISWKCERKERKLKMFSFFREQFSRKADKERHSRERERESEIGRKTKRDKVLTFLFPPQVSTGFCRDNASCNAAHT